MNDWHQTLRQLWGQRAKRRSWLLAFRPAAVLLILLTLTLGLVSCGGPSGDRAVPGGPNRLIGVPKTLQEVSPPSMIQALKQDLDVRPQVSITSPKRDEVLQDTQVSVRFQVEDLSAFKAEDLAMGPYLSVILDNEPYQAVYDLSQPLVLDDLDPGTHTLRAFASWPWHESFKNAEAYDQIQFHVFTKTSNSPDLSAPLLTYSQPKGSYGAEPIMLDVYLHNAPLHLIAQEDITDEVSDWKIRCTINGQVFTFDAWEPLYLKGFKSGKNWIQLELLDENGTLIKNAYNDTARLITLEPGGEDTLSRLVRGELSLQEARPMVIQGYEPAPEPEELEPEELEPEELEAEKTESLEPAQGAVDPLGVNNPEPGAPRNSVRSDDLIEAPEPISLPKTEAFPPGILMEETLPEMIPALEAEVEPESNTTPAPQPSPASPETLVTGGGDIGSDEPIEPISGASSSVESRDIETLPEIVLDSNQ